MSRCAGLLVAAVVSGILIPVATPHASHAVADCAPTQQDESSALSAAAACDQRVEVLADRTITNQVFANPDNTLTLEAAAVPQRVQQGDGSWSDIDPQLTPGSDGRLAPAASTAKVSFSAGGSSPLVEWTDDSGSRLTLTWPDQLPTPSIDGDSATYEAVYPGVDLIMRATSDGYKQVLVVHSAEAAANPALRSVSLIAGGTMSVRNTSQGLQVVDVDGTVAASSPASVMWDSSVDPTLQNDPAAPGPPADPADSTATEPGPATDAQPLPVVVNGSTLTIHPDIDALTSSDTTYPVFIDPAFSNLRQRWAYANSSNSNWDVNDQMWVGVDPSSGLRYRSYLGFDTGALNGTKVLSAEVDMNLDHSWSCDNTEVFMYRTGGGGNIPASSSGGRISWASLPLPTNTYVANWSGHANEAGGCGTLQPNMAATFDNAALRTDLQNTADWGWGGYTVGLCACDSQGNGETYQSRWKRFFSTSVYLRATYDRAPNIPTPQPFTTTYCYLDCDSPARIRDDQPQFRAKVSDPDLGAGANSAQLNTKFEVRASASDTGTLITSSGNVPVTIDSTHTTQIASWQPAANLLLNGKTYYWRARTTDEDGFASPDWSAFQTVTIDTTPPADPDTNSAEYPERSWGAPVNTKGSFKLTSSSDVAAYTWHVDSGAATATSAGGATQTITYTPPADMVHTMYVSAKDRAGNTDTAGSVPYQFWVTPAANVYSHWTLKEGSGTIAHDTVSTNSDGTPNTTANPGTTSGGVTLTASNIATFTGSGQIRTANASLDTTKAFTVALWTRFPTVPASDQTLIGQGSSAQDRFRLDYDAASHAFCFVMTAQSADPSTAPTTRACTKPIDANANPTDVQANVWYHVAGVYDPGATMTVNVMGGSNCTGATGTATPPPAWSATGPLIMGRSGDGTKTNWLIGDLSDVYAYHRPLPDTELCSLANQVPAAP